MNPRTDTTVGYRAVRATATTRQGMPLQDRTPSDLWPTATAVMAAPSGPAWKFVGVGSGYQAVGSLR